MFLYLRKNSLLDIRILLDKHCEWKKTTSWLFISYITINPSHPGYKDPWLKLFLSSFCTYMYIYFITLYFAPPLVTPWLPTKIVLSLESLLWHCEAYVIADSVKRLSETTLWGKLLEKNNIMYHFDRKKVIKDVFLALKIKAILNYFLLFKIIKGWMVIYR